MKNKVLNILDKVLLKTVILGLSAETFILFVMACVD